MRHRFLLTIMFQSKHKRQSQTGLEQHDDNFLTDAHQSVSYNSGHAALNQHPITW